MNRHLNKNYIEHFLFFTDCINNNITEQILKFNNISIIYKAKNTYNNIKELEEIIKFCKKNNIKFYISNNFKLAIKMGADGIYINNEFKNKLFFNKKINFKVIIGVHSQKEYFSKSVEKYDFIVVSPIFYNSKYSLNKILNPIKFNLLTNAWGKKIYALGGINLNNIKKIRLTKSIGIGFISLIEDRKIKKPVCHYNRRAFE
jgi:thiamine-phosphate pyrophosphorylase